MLNYEILNIREKVQDMISEGKFIVAYLDDGYLYFSYFDNFTKACEDIAERLESQEAVIIKSVKDISAIFKLFNTYSQREIQTALSRQYEEVEI